MWKNFFLLVTEIFRTHLMKSVRRVRACGVQDLHSLNGRRFYLFPFTVMIFRNTFALWYPGVLQIFIIFIQQQTKFPKNAFRLQFPASLTWIFFCLKGVWLMINVWDNARKAMDEWQIFAKWLQSPGERLTICILYAMDVFGTIQVAT